MEKNKLNKTVIMRAKSDLAANLADTLDTEEIETIDVYTKAEIDEIVQEIKEESNSEKIKELEEKCNKNITDIAAINEKYDQDKADFNNRLTELAQQTKEEIAKAKADGQQETMEEVNQKLTELDSKFEEIIKQIKEEIEQIKKELPEVHEG